ncbi:hypothetical protein BGX21_005935 [Mortierella sp. AD011]|nr:hypothetical protein BGX20_006556 [Mortierella sp. AD010]KAF9399602.1 hypothetical protein BGX21_005935 [Mortierella sp. AD011]
MNSREDIHSYPLTNQHQKEQSVPTHSSYTNPSVIDLFRRLSNPTKLSTEYCSSQDTGMDLAGSVVFSVNPPSPLESDLCADDQESILRTWHTSGPFAEDSLKGSSSEVHDKFEPDVMDHGIRTSSSSTETTQSNANIRTITQPSRSAGSLSSLPHANKGELPAKRSHGGPRRSSSNDTHRKSELYKTELCVSVNTGIPCKYGDNCQFAHSTQELQHVTRHPRYKTQFCTSFQSQGYCKYNDRCTFIHHPDEARVLTPISRESTSEKPTWSNSASNTIPGSGIITPASGPETNNNERLRAFSDPGIGYTEVLKHPVKTVDATNSVATAVGTPPQMLQGVPAAPNPQTVDAQIGSLGRLNRDPTSFLKPLSKKVISHKSDAITSAVEALGHCLIAPDYTTPIRYLHSTCAPPIAGLDLSPRPATFMPTVAYSTWSNPLCQQDPANPWRETTNVDDDEEWASKLAYYISTPQNDFDI